MLIPAATVVCVQMITDNFHILSQYESECISVKIWIRERNVFIFSCLSLSLKRHEFEENNDFSVMKYLEGRLDMCVPVVAIHICC